MALKLIDEAALDRVLSAAKDDLVKNPDVDGLREFVDFMTEVKAVLKPLPESYSKEDVRKIATQFFYYWWNTPGQNTEEGFDKWFSEVYPDQKQQPSTESQDELWEEVDKIVSSHGMNYLTHKIFEELKKQFTIKKINP